MRTELRTRQRSVGRGPRLVVGLVATGLVSLSAVSAGPATDCSGSVALANAAWNTTQDPRLLYLRQPAEGAESTAGIGRTVVDVAMDPGTPVPEDRSSARVAIRRDPLVGDRLLRSSGSFVGPIRALKVYLFRGTQSHAAPLERLWVQLVVDGQVLHAADTEVVYNGHSLVTCHPFSGWYALRLAGIDDASPSAGLDAGHSIELTVAPPLEQMTAPSTTELLGMDDAGMASRVLVNPSEGDFATPQTHVGP